MAGPDIIIEPSDGQRASITVEPVPPASSKLPAPSNITFADRRNTGVLLKDPAVGAAPKKDRLQLEMGSRRPPAPAAAPPKRFGPPAGPGLPKPRFSQPRDANPLDDLDDFNFEDAGSLGGGDSEDGPLPTRKPAWDDDNEDDFDLDGMGPGGGGGGGGGQDDDEMDEDAAFEPELRPAPGYKSLDEEKADLLFKLGRLRQRAHIVDGVPFTIHSDIRDVRAEYSRVKATLELDSSIKFQRRLLTTIVSGLEWCNGKWGKDYLDMDLDGFSEHTFENIDDYDTIFEKLHEKWRGTGTSLPPEVELLLTVAGSALAFNMAKKMFKGVQSPPPVGASPQYQAPPPPPPPQHTRAGPPPSGSGRREMQGPPDLGGMAANLGPLGGMAANFNPLGMMLGGMPNPQPTRMARADELRELPPKNRGKRRPRSESSDSSSGGESAMLSEDGALSLPSLRGHDFDGMSDFADLLSEPEPAPPKKKTKKILKL